MIETISLGIESTAHTVGIGIINDKGKVLANEKSVYRPELGKGIHPREAGEHHSKNIVNLIKYIVFLYYRQHNKIPLIYN